MLKKRRLEQIKWRRINMRNVTHLIAVEFIHDLYNRHDPSINSVRFRHTKTTWKNGIVNSYAPEHEWQLLENTLGNQYYHLDYNTIIYTKKLYKRKRKLFRHFMRHIKDIDVTTISNAKLFSLLLQFQSIVLGDLYILNFVQVEHSLNTAIKKVLKEITKDKSIDGLYSSLIQTNITTASGKERRHLYTIANKWRILKKFSLYDEQKVALDIKRHTKKYGYLYSAYGETPKDYQSFYLDFMKYFTDHTLKPKNSYFTKILHKESKKLLKQLNNKKLDILVPLLVSGGVFRDTNKAFLGQSTKYRLKIIKEVKRRTKIKETHITHYLLSEIGELLLKGSKVPEETISNRKKNGVTLTRNEDITITNTPEMSTEKKVGFTNLKGICASPGKSTGTCKVVYTKKDIQKVKKGDIMIAIGTDFDLIEAMHKSSAVITEEGGILSHASVVCREMQKPCCIGVKEATNILYDGLEVTVDATKGLIIPLD